MSGGAPDPGVVVESGRTRRPAELGGPDAGPAELPVKLVLERRARPGQRPAFETWARRLLATATRAPGALRGSSVLAQGDDHVLLLCFSSRAALEGWQGCAEVVALLAEGETVGEGPVGAPNVQTGLETWFTVPGVPAAGPPPRWKMALVTWLALMPLVWTTGHVVPSGLPWPATLAVSTAIPVVLLTWVVMPALARLLRGWLQPAPVR